MRSASSSSEINLIIRVTVMFDVFQMVDIHRFKTSITYGIFLLSKGHNS